jgi:hypothetical protein
MEKTIYLLTEAPSKDMAEYNVRRFLEVEEAPYDDYEIHSKETDALSALMEKITEAHSGFDSITLAERYIKQAEAEKAEQDYSLTAHYYRKAATLYEGSLTYDCSVYNIDEYDYSIPLGTQGWFAVPVVFYL